MLNPLQYIVKAVSIFWTYLKEGSGSKDIVGSKIQQDEIGRQKPNFQIGFKR